jgi:TetR/AcrR family transcriptional repressor of bet genes
VTSLDEIETVTTRTASREVRRRQLILAAIDSIAERGFSGTTLKHVTAGANLSHGVVNFHFANKETLYIETLGYLVNEHFDIWFASMTAAGPDPVDQLAAVVEADFDDRVCSPKKLAVWFAFWGQAKYRPNYLQVHNKHDEARLVQLNRLCREIIDDGGYGNLDAEQVSRTLEALIDGLWLNMMLYPSVEKQNEGRADCFGALAEFFPKHFPQNA